MRGVSGNFNGSHFLTWPGKLIDRTYVAQSIRRLCPTAPVPEEKGSPRCLRKMYRTTREGIERDIALLVERAKDRPPEEEQLTVRWDNSLVRRLSPRPRQYSKGQ